LPNVLVIYTGRRVSQCNSKKCDGSQTNFNGKHCNIPFFPVSLVVGFLKNPLLAYTTERCTLKIACFQDAAVLGPRALSSRPVGRSRDIYNTAFVRARPNWTTSELYLHRRPSWVLEANGTPSLFSVWISVRTLKKKSRKKFKNH